MTPCDLLSVRWCPIDQPSTRTQQSERRGSRSKRVGGTTSAIGEVRPGGSGPANRQAGGRSRRGAARVRARVQTRGGGLGAQWRAACTAANARRRRAAHPAPTRRSARQPSRSGCPGGGEAIRGGSCGKDPPPGCTRPVGHDRPPVRACPENRPIHTVQGPLRAREPISGTSRRPLAAQPEIQPCQVHPGRYVTELASRVHAVPSAQQLDASAQGRND